MTRKYITVFLIFFLIPLSFIFANTNQNAAITAAADNGMNISNCPDSALESAATYAREKGFVDAATRIENELASRYETRASMAAEAEKAAAIAVKELMEEQAALEKALAELKALEEKNIGDLDLSNENLIQDAMQTVEDCKNKVQIAKAKVSESADAMSKAYLALGQFYEDTQFSGDPVKIGTGEYVADYEDFVAQDFGTKFKTIRTLTSQNYEEGFGTNWTCSLASRIVRCTTGPMDEKLRLLSKCLSCINKGLQLCEAYNQDFPAYSNTTINEYFDQLNLYKTKISFYLNKATIADMQNKASEQMNKYVLYGRFKNYKNYYYLDNAIVFVDENGQDYLFEYKDNGQWNALSPITNSQIKIFSINASGAKINSKSSYDGFLVEYKNGVKRYYNQYGILSKEIDVHGNTTLYNSSNGVITEIKLKTGESLIVKYNDRKQINEISGNVSGSAKFFYENNKLIKVEGNDSVVVGFNYDVKGSVTAINKADGSSVLIKYGTDSAGRKVCTSVTDENNNIESFVYDHSKRQVEHITLDGKTEKFFYNSYGNVIHKVDENNEQCTFITNNLGLIVGENRKQNSFTYTYDSDFNVIKKLNSNGKYKSYTYDKNGNLTKYIDEDGFYYSWEYDHYGNLINSSFCSTVMNTCSYYPNGLLKELNENGCTYLYEYNNFGNIVKRTVIDSSRQNQTPFIEVWKYDNKNRLIEYKNADQQITQFSYSKNYKCEITPSNLKIEHYYNSRNWEVKNIQTDLSSGISYTKEIFYDGKGNVIKIKIDDNIFASYDYLPSGKIKSYTIWNIPINNESSIGKHGINTSFDFDEKGRIIAIKRKLEREDEKFIPIKETEKILAKIEYSNRSNSVEIKQFVNHPKPFKYIYNDDGKLITEEYPDGYNRKYIYSAASRLISCIDSNGINKIYNYKTDGTVHVSKTFRNGIEEIYSYNPAGQLTRRKDFLGNYSDYLYDGQGYLISETSNNLKVLYSYSLDGKLLKSEYFDNKRNLFYVHEKLIDGNWITEKSGNYIISKVELDGWERPVKKESSHGNQNFIYNCLGQPVEIRSGNQTVKKIEYDALGKICFLKSQTGMERLFTSGLDGRKLNIYKNGKSCASFDYDDYGNLTKFENELGSLMSFSYDSNGIISSINRYDTGEIKFSWYGNQYSLIDGNRNRWIKNYDSNGNLINKINPMGKIEKYTYTNEGFINSQTDCIGNIKQISIDSVNNIKKITYGDGSNTNIKRNYFNSITDLENKNVNLHFDYDEAFKIINQIDDKAELKIQYSYDEFGRVTGKKSDYFEIFNTYDNKGKISSIKEKKSGNSVSFTRNADGLVTELKYSDGTMCYKSYNDFGQIEAEIYKDNLSQILKADFTLYDDKNRIILQCNSKGDFKRFSYDKQGRLVKTEVSYSGELYSNELDGFINCGGFEPADSVKLENISFTEIEKQSLNTLLKNADLNVNLFSIEKAWFTEYEYTNNGAIAVEKNPLGKIIYEYDENGRLILKHASNTKKFGIKYEWNDNDCLVLEESQFYKKQYTYNYENRPVNISYIDFKNEKETFCNYTYDGIGRRYSEQINGGQKYIYIYEGLSTVVLGIIPVFENGYKNIYASNFQEFNGEYRTVKDNAVTSNFRSVNKSFDYNATENNLAVNVCCDGIKIFTVINESDFNIIGLSGKNENPNPNQGYRDYSESMKSFISIDPTFDGGNYFSYCAADPVNYVDIQGFKKTSLTKGQEAKFNAAIADYLKFDQEEFAVNGWSNLPKEFDCADTTAMINYTALQAAGVDSVTDDLTAFGKFLEEGKVQKAREQINSKSFFEDGADNSYTPLFRGYDRNYLRNTQFEGEEKYTQEIMNREVSLWNMSNPEYISPGTALVWKSSEYTTSSDKSNWTGHTLTVLARDFDGEGNVIGFAYIEGHQNINTLTELGYMNLKQNNSNQCDLDLWRGEFLGAYEMENSNAHWDGIIKNNCTK